MWRLRAIIYTAVLVNPDVIENENFIYSIIPVNNSNTENGDLIQPNYRYLDIKYKHIEIDIHDGFAILYEELNCFVDKVVFLTYGEAIIVNIISICPNKVNIAEPFEIAFPHISIVRKTVSLNLSDCQINNELNDTNQRLIRLIRNGINTVSIEDKFLNFYTVLEEIARNESQEIIHNVCNNCQTKVSKGRKATNNFIKDILSSYNIDAKSIKLASELRNKIAHGGAKKNKEYLSDVQNIASLLEEISMLEVEKRINYKVINRLNVHIIDIPVVTHNCVANTDGSFDLVKTSLNMPARFIKLEPSGDLGDQMARIGLPTDSSGKPFIYHPFAWPEIK